MLIKIKFIFKPLQSGWDVEGRTDFSPLSVEVGGGREALQNENDPLIGAPDSFKTIRCFDLEPNPLFNKCKVSPTPSMRP